MTRHSDGLLRSASIGLSYPVRARLVYSVVRDDSSSSSDVLSIKCTAKIGNAYWQSVVEKTTVKRQGRMLESRSNAAEAGPFVGRGEKRCPFTSLSLFSFY